MSTLEKLEERAIALLKQMIETCKDDGQGLAVKVQDGDKAIELSLTAKPSQYSRGGGGTGGSVAHTEAEVEAAMVAAGLKKSEYKVWSDNGKVWATWPYAKKDEPGLKALGMRWDGTEKASWAPLSGAPAPSQ